MAMTLRLSPEQTEALRRRADAEGASMQDVARRAVDAYIRAREAEASLGALIDGELDRFAEAVDQLGRWQS